jgi:myo-inositol 2-dehydrogenase / D-chiro-inositol 1-dehydrogenase
MMQTPFRTLVVGYGNRGRMWAEVTARADSGAVLSGIVDPSAERRQVAADAHAGCRTFPDLDSALQAGGHDGVVLVTPPYNRLAQAQAVFDAGLPLLAEKPLTLDLHEARAIVELSEQRGLALMVGLNFRFLPVSRKLRELIGEEFLGPLGFGQFNYIRNRDGRRPGLNKYPLEMQHPMMLEQSIHHLDLIRYCYRRDVSHVACRTFNPSWSMYRHDANVSCLLTLNDGVEVNYQGTWTSGWNDWAFGWRSDCARGVIVQQQLFSDLAFAATEDAALTPIALPAFEAFYDDTAALLGAFITHLRSGAELECSGRDHLETLALCFAAIESSEQQRVVEMAEFRRRYGI